MKEVERVSLGGYAFTFDDDAARLTEEYLGQLEKHYDGRTGGSEIMDCIEERMAELLTEKAGREGVVSRTMIEEVIGILGRPEDIEAGEEGDSPDKATPSFAGSTGESPKRKLYRDMTDKMVAGVCSGLAAYFNIEATIFRLVFAIGTAASMFGRWNGHFAIHLSFPVLYVLLWICMPPAKTVRQRWEQRGEDGTLEGIKRSIERGIESGAREVDNALQSVGKSKAWTEIGGFIEKFIGVILLIVGFAGLFTGSLWGFGSGWFGRRHGHGLFGLGRPLRPGPALRPGHGRTPPLRPAGRAFALPARRQHPADARLFPALPRPPVRRAAAPLRLQVAEVASRPGDLHPLADVRHRHRHPDRHRHRQHRAADHLVQRTPFDNQLVAK